MTELCHIRAPININHKGTAMRIKPDRLVQCALYAKCPLDSIAQQEYAYVDCFSIGDVEIFICTLRTWHNDYISYFTTPGEAVTWIKETTYEWDVKEGEITL